MPWNDEGGDEDDDEEDTPKKSSKETYQLKTTAKKSKADKFDELFEDED